MSNERQINYVNEIQNRVQNLYYVDDASELNSVDLKENDKIYAINDNKLFQMEIADQDEELSGSIVSFNGRNNTKIKSVVANIVPVQSGTGDPSPDNVRPISGWTGANIYGRNVNIATFSELLPRYGTSSSGINLTVSNGKMTFSGTATASGTKFFGGFSTYAQRVFPVKAGVTYCVSTKNLGDNAWIQGNIENDDGTAVPGWIVVNQSADDRKYRTFTSAKNGRIAFLPVANLTSGQEFNATIEDIQMTIGTTSAFKGEAVSTTFPINWQTEAGTIYDGTVTLNEDGSADVVATWAGKELDGVNNKVNIANTYYIGNITTRAYKSLFSTNAKNPVNATSESALYSTTGTDVQRFYITPSNGETNIFILNSLTGITSQDTAASAATKMNAYLAEHPFRFIYELATPESPIHIPNIGQLYTYLGTNNVWSDIGDITVKIAEKGITAFELEPYI